MNKFQSIQFRPYLGGVVGRLFFDNGYGASVVRHLFSYGGEDGLWEVAVLEGNEDFFALCYDTPLTSDFIGYLTEAEVEDTLLAIETLPKRGDE